MHKIYIRFECGMYDIVGPTFGPYDYVQLTYAELRAGTELSQDLTLAEFIHEEDEWRINGGQLGHEIAAGRVDFSSCQTIDPDLSHTIWYSDIILYSEV